MNIEIIKKIIKHLNTEHENNPYAYVDRIYEILNNPEAFMKTASKKISMINMEQVIQKTRIIREKIQEWNGDDEKELLNSIAPTVKNICMEQNNFQCYFNDKACCNSNLVFRTHEWANHILNLLLNTNQTIMLNTLDNYKQKSQRDCPRRVAASMGRVQEASPSLDP